MESSIQAVMGRIQEIEARLGIAAARTAPTASPTIPSLPGANRSNPATTPFPVLMAAQLKPMGGGQFSPQIEGLISKYSAQYGIQPQLIRAVIKVESDGNPTETSGAGAKGLMQLMPENLQVYGVSDPFDPEQNIAAGTRHLSSLLHEFDNDIPKSLAAYNAGSGAVHRYHGIPPFTETQHYVKKIMGMLGAH